MAAADAAKEGKGAVAAARTGIRSAQAARVIEEGASSGFREASQAHSPVRSQVDGVSREGPQGRSSHTQIVAGKHGYLRSGEDVPGGRSELVLYDVPHDIGQAAFEKKIATEETEIATAFHQDGRMAMQPRIGTEKSVVVHAWEKLKDTIMVHSHPGGEAFSTSDVGIAVQHDARETRVVLPDFTAMSLLRPQGGWPSSESMRQAIVDAHFEAAERLDVIVDEREGFLRRSLTPEEKVHISNDLIIAQQIRAFSRLGVIMRRVRL
jgi:hypothetical protein